MCRFYGKDHLLGRMMTQPKNIVRPTRVWNINTKASALVSRPLMIKMNEYDATADTIIAHVDDAVIFIIVHIGKLSILV